MAPETYTYGISNRHSDFLDITPLYRNILKRMTGVLSRVHRVALPPLCSPSSHFPHHIHRPGICFPDAALRLKATFPAPVCIEGNRAQRNHQTGTTTMRSDWQPNRPPLGNQPSPSAPASGERSRHRSREVAAHTKVQAWLAGNKTGAVSQFDTLPDRVRRIAASCGSVSTS